MNFVKGLTQAGPFVLLLCALMCFGIACACHMQDVRAKILDAAGMLIVGALAAFKHPDNVKTSDAPATPGAIPNSQPPA